MIRCMLPVQPNLEVIKAHGVLSKRWPISARKIFTNTTNIGHNEKQENKLCRTTTRISTFYISPNYAAQNIENRSQDTSQKLA